MDESSEEITVVGHDDQGAIELFQGIFQDVLGTEVEMVGRLVENQQVHGREQQLDHGQSGTLSTGQNFHLFVDVVTAEHESSQHILDFVFQLHGSYIVDSLENGKAFVHERGLVLGEIANLHVVSQCQFSGIGNFSHDTFYQRGLSFPVTTDESDFLSLLNREVGILEHDVSVIVFRKFFCDHRVFTGVRGGREFQSQCGSVFLVNFQYFQFLQHFHAGLYL